MAGMAHQAPPDRPGAAFWATIVGLALVLAAAIGAALWALHHLNVI